MLEVKFVFDTGATTHPGRVRNHNEDCFLARPASGLWLVVLRGSPWFNQAGWLHIKLGLVLGLVIYHGYLGRCVTRFAADANRHGHVYYRWLNEAPVLILVAAVLLAILQPF